MNSRLAFGFSWRRHFLAHLSGPLTIIFLAACGHLALGQQTLGSINGYVTDSSGAVIQGAQVKARATATNLEVAATSKADGSFSIADLPIGTYEVKFIKDGFETDVHPQILVQGNRTATINAKLTPGMVSASVTVEATPLLNETDTTTGYTLNESQITRDAAGYGQLYPVGDPEPGRERRSAEHRWHQRGTRQSGDLGQRAARHQQQLHDQWGDANNIFNGKSTSQVTSSRVAVNIGENGNGNNPSGEIVTSTSVYGAIGAGAAFAAAGNDPGNARQFRDVRRFARGQQRSADQRHH